ncbi:hypothetical protein PWG14_17885 (plasmid) [Chromobacterium amazonense]|nr:hypothetical protein [Chromobacterium amazonense]
MSKHTFILLCLITAFISYLLTLLTPTLALLSIILVFIVIFNPWFERRFPNGEPFFIPSGIAFGLGLYALTMQREPLPFLFGQPTITGIGLLGFSAFIIYLRGSSRSN